MPFGLRKTSTTWQRLVNNMFEKHIGDTMEVYIHDMLVKSKKVGDHINHLEEAFKIPWRYQMKLKHSFDVAYGKFLAYIVTQWGTEASREQIKAIFNLQSPKCVKDVQRLTRRVVALNIFKSKLLDSCKLFYDMLRKNKSHEWINRKRHSRIWRTTWWHHLPWSSQRTKKCCNFT